MMRVIAVVAFVLVAGCAGVEELTGQAPIVDMSGVDLAQYDADLLECRAYADQVLSGRQVATGTAAGAVIGGAVGAIGGSGRSVARTAGIGAVAGGTHGAGGAMRDRRQVIRNCLGNRGYNVLN